MTDAVTISLIAAVGSFLGAAMSVFNNTLARRNNTKLEQTQGSIVTLEHNTNAMKDELVRITGTSKYAEGLKDGTDAKALPVSQGPPGKQGPRGKKGNTGKRGATSRRAASTKKHIEH